MSASYSSIPGGGTSSDMYDSPTGDKADDIQMKPLSGSAGDRSDGKTTAASSNDALGNTPEQHYEH